MTITSNSTTIWMIVFLFMFIVDPPVFPVVLYAKDIVSAPAVATEGGCGRPSPPAVRPSAGRP
jgi:hypothetical protein